MFRILEDEKASARLNQVYPVSRILELRRNVLPFETRVDWERTGLIRMRQTAQPGPSRPHRGGHMNTGNSLERCLSFIHCHIQPPGGPAVAWQHAPKAAVTISREAGCGAHAFAEMLAALLNTTRSSDAPEWTIFDRNLIETVLTDHQLPTRLAEYMPEDRKLEMDDIIEELFGLHPSSLTLVDKISETILHLAEVGNAIIIGRGANIVTARLPHVFHIRLIGSRERRIQNLQSFEKLPRAEAETTVTHEDLARARYVRKNFHQDVANPLLYHLVINTDNVAHTAAAEIAARLVMHSVWPKRQHA